MRRLRITFLGLALLKLSGEALRSMQTTENVNESLFAAEGK